jgi:hypothetical protein
MVPELGVGATIRGKLLTPPEQLLRFRLWQAIFFRIRLRNLLSN